jgi:rod shape-determining protein MreD
VRLVIYGAIGLIALLAQMGIVPHILIDGQGPMLGLVPVVVIGLLYGPGEGAWAGAVIGALVDFSVGGAWGLATLLSMAAGFGAGRLAFVGRGARTLLAFFVCALAVLLVQAFAVVGIALGGGNLAPSALLGGMVSVLYTAVLAPPLLILLDGGVGRQRPASRAQV